MSLSASQQTLPEMTGFRDLVQLKKISKGQGKKECLESKMGLTRSVLLRAGKHHARCDQKLLHAHHGVSTAEEIYPCGNAGLSTEADVCLVLCLSWLGPNK